MLLKFGCNGAAKVYGRTARAGVRFEGRMFGVEKCGRRVSEYCFEMLRE